MRVLKLTEHGHDEAMLGLSLSYQSDVDRMSARAVILARKEGGHNKFLESIQTWWDILAPRFWWQEMDTYRVGISKQSESTMHTLTRQPLTQDDFEYPIYDPYLDHLNQKLLYGASLEEIKNDLPDGFLQRRVVNMNYKTLRNIIHQRRSHKLPQWQFFIQIVLEQVSRPAYLEVQK